MDHQEKQSCPPRNEKSGGAPPEDDQSGVAETLWTRRDLAAYLKVSDRWVDSALRRKADERGSIPHVELPTNGSRRFVRFVPEVIQEWARLGFPVVADFEALVEE